MAALHAVAQSPPLPRGGLTFSSAERARQKAKPAALPAQKGNEAGANACREERHGNMITRALAAFLANLAGRQLYCRPMRRGCVLCLLSGTIIFSVPHRSKVWRPGDEMRIRTHSHLSPKTLHFPPYFWEMPLQFGMGKTKRAYGCQKFQSLQRKRRERELCQGTIL